jgi:hypothetical protein
MAGQAPPDGEVLMRYLPDDHRYPPPPQWESVERHNRPARGLLTYITVLAAGVGLGSIAREAFTVPPQPPRIVVMQNAASPAAPAQQSSFWNWLNGNRCTEPDGHVRGWGNQNYAGGGGPVDVFGFLPKCNEGGR